MTKRSCFNGTDAPYTQVTHKQFFSVWGCMGTPTLKKVVDTVCIAGSIVKQQINLEVCGKK